MFDCVTTSTTSYYQQQQRPFDSISNMNGLGVNLNANLMYQQTTNHQQLPHFQQQFNQPQAQHQQQQQDGVFGLDEFATPNDFCYFSSTSPDMTTGVTNLGMNLQAQAQTQAQQTNRQHQYAQQHNHQQQQAIGNTSGYYHCSFGDEVTGAYQQQYQQDYTNLDSIEPSLIPTTQELEVMESRYNHQDHQQHNQNLLLGNCDGSMMAQHQPQQQGGLGTSLNQLMMAPPQLPPNGPQQPHQHAHTFRTSNVSTGVGNVPKLTNVHCNQSANNSNNSHNGGAGGLPAYYQIYQHSSPTGSTHTSSGSTDLSEDMDEMSHRPNSSTVPTVPPAQQSHRPNSPTGSTVPPRVSTVPLPGLAWFQPHLSVDETPSLRSRARPLSPTPLISFGFTPAYKQKATHDHDLNRSSSKNKRQTKKRKPKRDPNEPQKPVSAYALFFRDTQATIKGKSPNASFGEVSKIVASMWDGLDVEAKNTYKQKTESAKKDYLKQLATYRANLLARSGVQTNGVDQFSVDVPFAAPSSNSSSRRSSAAHQNAAADSTTPTSLASNAGDTSSSGPGALPLASGVGQKSLASLIAEPAPQQLLTATTTLTVPQSYNSMNRHKIEYDLVDNVDFSNTNLCQHSGCSKNAVESQQWDRNYCSNECVVKHCRDVFGVWVRNRQSAENGGGTYAPV